MIVEELLVARFEADDEEEEQVSDLRSEPSGSIGCNTDKGTDLDEILDEVTLTYLILTESTKHSIAMLSRAVTLLRNSNSQTCLALQVFVK